MYRRIMPLLIFGSFIVMYADSAVQTDWSGGDGILGPVLDWSNRFYQSSEVDWYDNMGSLLLSQVFQKNIVDDYFENACSAYSADIDGDGDMDILGAAIVGDEFAWWENDDGSGTSWTKHIVAENYWLASSVYSEDYDDDGDMDVLGSGHGEIIWWENDDGSGLSWTEHTVDANFDGVRSICSKDVNGDGYLDILGAAESSSGGISWWENSDTDPGIYWIKRPVGEYDYAMSVYSEDIDGDGDMDVIGASRGVNDITWWENVDGSGTSWAEHTVDGNVSTPYSVHSQDINGDGDMDILAATLTGNDIIWWKNDDGSGTSWVKYYVAEDFNMAKSVYSTDLDGDGDMDILGASSFYDSITWWENIDGLGTSWVKHTVDDNFNGACCVYSEDINGDGNMDILGTAPQAHEISWWDLTGYSAEGSLESTILNTDCSPQWASIEWNCSEPAGVDLYFQYRTSDDPGNMGIWSDPIHEPCLLSGLLDQYFQYKVSMESNNPDLTPVLQDLTLNWDPYGIEGDPSTTEYTLLGVIPNPACGAISIHFGLPEFSIVRLSVFDLSGRLISEVHDDEYSSGFHDVLLGDFTPGIYFCRMISGDFKATQRFVVI